LKARLSPESAWIGFYKQQDAARLHSRDRGAAVDAMMNCLLHW
jgi:hypothetical protein